MEKPTLEKLSIELEQEDDGRWIAEVIDLPGVLVYGRDQIDATRKALKLAQRVVADRGEHGETPSGAAKEVQRRVVRLFEGLELDSYQMVDGEFRLGAREVGKVLGFAEAELWRILDEERNLQKVMIELGERQILTISLSDFMQLLSLAVFKGKKAALALQVSLIEASLKDFFIDTSKEASSLLDEKQEAFYETYAAIVSPGNWKEMTREEILRLTLPDNETA